MTDSDAKLKRDLAYQRKMLALCESRGKSHEELAQKYRDLIASTEKLLAMPRDQRPQYEIGSI